MHEAYTVSEKEAAKLFQSTPQQGGDVAFCTR